MEAQTATKGEFALLASVSAGRVSQWIAEGKITPAEMVGEGRSARIKVGPAMEKLKLRLNPAQRLGNGVGTTLSAPLTKEPDAGTITKNDPPPSPLDELDLALKQQKLKQAEAQNRKLQEEERARAGQYVLARHASSEAGKIASTILQMFESGLADVAAEIAAEYKLPARDIIHFMRTRFREVRAKVSTQIAGEAEGLAPLVEDDQDH